MPPSEESVRVLTLLVKAPVFIRHRNSKFLTSFVQEYTEDPHISGQRIMRARPHRVNSGAAVRASAFNAAAVYGSWCVL